MKTITLKVLAEDIKTSRYTNSRDCAIARALKREGIEGSHSSIAIGINGKYTRLSDDVNLKIRQMYFHLDRFANYGDDVTRLGSLEPEDFEFAVTIPD